MFYYFIITFISSISVSLTLLPCPESNIIAFRYLTIAQELSSPVINSYSSKHRLSDASVANSSSMLRNLQQNSLLVQCGTEVAVFLSVFTHVME